MSLILIGLAGLALSLPLGGLLAGLDRRVTARCQSRIGPPLAQPFYDAIKLWAKPPLRVNIWTGICSRLYFLCAAASVGLFFAGQNLLLVFFTQAAGSAFLVMGAMAQPSPYSQVGAQRELLQTMAYEPFIILAVAAIRLGRGTMSAWDLLNLDRPLIFDAPLILLVLTIVLCVKLRKSPFDLSASHHAHQELVRGVFTEYSGRDLALCELAHWLDTVLVLGLISLFWSTNPLGMILLPAGAYLLEILVDNATARLRWRNMLAACWGPGLFLAICNLIWLAAKA